MNKNNFSSGLKIIVRCSRPTFPTSIKVVEFPLRVFLSFAQKVRKFGSVWLCAITEQLVIPIFPFALSCESRLAVAVRARVASTFNILITVGAEQC